ncbi:sec-independent protein translocase protein TatB [Rhizobium sp. BK529]|uniref:Sec-independent protein translocase protein TatB n=1 Tax=unclassified Rhizobium TaxID=2613769 RepID=UPI001051D543|nr:MULTISPECIES: Sec-independent protein translocase protein TatB [unclassified Rhizobium]MBB3591462.1 sec-independent protein translocase protein TatB [Rhizobium sp. BK529]TCS08587.1 sec-independent protein translocase protein TatB [Rhizobium sp. BK418]
MFDIGWTELLVIAVVLIVVVGPKDLPPMLRAFGKMTARARKVAGEFRAQFDEALREAELDDVRRTISDAQKLNPVNSLREAMNPLRQMGNEIKADLQNATRVDTPAEQGAENKTEMPLSDVSAPAPSLSLPETPPVVPAPQPVAAAAAAPVAVVEKPKAVRKPRVKAADKADAAASAAAPVEKPKRVAATKKPTEVKKPAAKKKKDEA